MIPQEDPMWNFQPLARLQVPWLRQMHNQEGPETAPETNGCAGHEGWTCREESPDRRLGLPRRWPQRGTRAI